MIVSFAMVFKDTIASFYVTSSCAKINEIPILLAPVVQNAIHRINHYPADSVVCFVKTYPLDSDLSSG